MIEFVKYAHFPPHLTQMLQIATLSSDYQYQIAQSFIVSSTESAT